MLLELGKAVSFLATIVSLYPVGIAVFFEPASRWQERLLLALPKLATAFFVALASALLFTWPVRSNPDAGQALTSTLPARVFLWVVAGMAALFVVSWYLMCGVPYASGLSQGCPVGGL